MGNPLKFRNRISGDVDKGAKPTQLESYPSERCPSCNSPYLARNKDGKEYCLVCGWS